MARRACGGRSPPARVFRLRPGLSRPARAWSLVALSAFLVPALMALVAGPAPARLSGRGFRPARLHGEPAPRPWPTWRPGLRLFFIFALAAPTFLAFLFVLVRGGAVLRSSRRRLAEALESAFDQSQHPGRPGPTALGDRPRAGPQRAGSRHRGHRTALRGPGRGERGAAGISRAGPARGQSGFAEAAGAEAGARGQSRQPSKSGKAAGAWGLSPDANESSKGFLLNHVIAEELPPCEDGEHLSNSDPVTGQAAWYDVRVKVYKADKQEPEQSWPQFKPLPLAPGMEKRRGRWQGYVAGMFRKKGISA